MSPTRSPPPPDAKDPVSALIETLHQTGRRLEELTGGEVDAVADRDGRTFLLRQAQDQLRQSNAVKQAAILNALPAHLALLDAEGIIVSVNEAWSRSSAAEASHGASHGVGVNYLAACTGASGDYSADAHRIAGGLRSVLSGAATSYSIEYACSAPEAHCWFLLTVTPLTDGGPGGAVVMRLNITERKHGENELLRLGIAMDALSDAIYLVDRTKMCFVHVNDAACRMQNMTRAELLALGPAKLLSVSTADLERQYDDLIGKGAAEPLEALRRRADGSPVWVEIRRHLQRSGDGWLIVTLVREITERKEAEHRIGRLNRVYAMLSGINTLIVRERDRDELFREACRIAVEEGGFRLSWIGMIDRTAMKVVPVASAGADDGFLELVRERLTIADDAPEGHGVTALAVRRKQAIAVNDVAADRRVSLKQAHAKRGLRSMVSLPLLIGDETVGTFDLHSAEVGVFDETEMKLLLELAGDIAFALDHIQNEEKLHYLAYYDATTGLANQTLFLERLQEKLLSSSDQSKKAVFVLDIARFKSVNDAFGRKAGDQLLKQVAARLVQIGGGDASRFGHIEANRFAIIARDMTSVEDVGRYVEQKLDSTFHDPFAIEDIELRVSVKVGIALFPDDGTSAETLFRKAEAALKKAKGSGDRYLFFNEAMTERVAERISIEHKLRQALDNEEFVLHYQPKVNLATGKLTGAEALIRWNDPRSGLVPPNMFIPILEETGLIHDVGRWALRRALEDYLRWRSQGLPAMRIAVNVSSLQLRHRGFVAEIERAIGIDPRAAAGLELEITESMIMADMKQCIATLHAIRSMGVSIAIDDFGTGFSSLGYLSKLPVDTLKIDRTFVVEMTVSQQGLTLVSTIVNLARSFKLKTVAEGVETEEQARLLRLLNCDEMQGYLFGKPVSREVFEEKYLSLAPEA